MNATMTKLLNAAPGSVWRLRTLVIGGPHGYASGYASISMDSRTMSYLSTQRVHELSGWTREKVLMLYEHDPEALWRAVVRELARRDEGC